MTVLGISGLYHDSAAAIIQDGVILAAAQEERFSRKKNDSALPLQAIDYCLQTAGIAMYQADAVVYYDQPLLTLDRTLHSIGNAGKEADYLAEHGLENLAARLLVDASLRKRYGLLGKDDKLYTVEHHRSHAASAFYPSPFETAAILTIDGVGEWATTTIGEGNGNQLALHKQINYPDSLGLFYDAFTAFCGFKVNSGEYKFMGLAPYGVPRYEKLIRDELIELYPDGSFHLNPEYFCYDRSAVMTGDSFARLFGGPGRRPEERITRREMDLAASAQRVTEDVILALAREAKRLTGSENLCMAGGVALNCTANGKIRRSGIFDRIWIQPAAGDAGGAIGCAYAVYYQLSGAARKPQPQDSQQGSFLGPDFSEKEIETALEKNKLNWHKLEDRELFQQTAALLNNNKVVGWFQGRMEFGPRALGGRSILASPRSADMQSRLNLAIKFRESFRPFAPAVLLEDAKDYFEMEQPSPYMLEVAQLRHELQFAFNTAEKLQEENYDMLKVVNQPRSQLPAITHVDGSARVQTVTKERNGRFYDLLKEYKAQSGCSVLVNTSFNVRGEPIVCTPQNAIDCFLNTDMDALVLGSMLVLKEEQQQTPDLKWRNRFEPD
ncbi:MAG: carbamoyltransferase [Oscillospiraceae bacterium]|nr:carbamoyltransferase [Oscillospiraceae bacterium]